MIDLHLHSSFSSDSDELPENYIKLAAARGDRAIGFSEHYDYDAYLENPEKRDCLFNIEEFFESCNRLSEKYPKVKILKGIELGFCADAVSRYKSLLSAHSFDYAILSVHTQKGRGDCYYPEYFKGLTRAQAYENYLKTLLQSVKSEINFQIVGHIGYITRYAPYEDRRLAQAEFSDIIDEILKQIISRGACLEINTSAKGSGFDFLPETEIIERFIALGGENFTFGSDAHSTERYLQGADAVKKYLKSLGVTKLCRFEKFMLFKEDI